jgi:hypothetical protein
MLLNVFDKENISLQEKRKLKEVFDFLGCGLEFDLNDEKEINCEIEKFFKC